MNDFRGVPAQRVTGGGVGGGKDVGKSGKDGKLSKEEQGKAIVNAEFREVWDGRPGRGERCMCVWVLPAGKSGKGKGIKKGEEILVSYGRGFWGARMGGDGKGEVDWEAEYQKRQDEERNKEG